MVLVLWAASLVFSKSAFADAGFRVKDGSGSIPTLKDVRLVLPDGWGSVDFSGRDRVRYENWDYFRSNTDNRYDFFDNQLRLSAKWMNEYFNGNFTWQYTQMGNLPSHASTGAGSGAIYFGSSHHRDSYGQFVKYLNADIKDFLHWRFTETLGRFNYSSGNEMKSDDKKLDWLKSQRIADRMIGGFEWSDYGRSFDGGRAIYANDALQLEAADFHPTQGGFEETAQREISGINVVAVEGYVKKDKLIPGMEANLFYYGYDDERVIAATTARFDNTGRSVTAGQESDIEIHTFGGHLIGDYNVGPGVWDVLGWGAVQTGSWYELDQRAYAFAAETGYQWDKSPWKPWLRAGFDYGSGDDNASDGKHGTFFQMLPTGRLYSSSILYNMENSEDFFLSLVLKPVNSLTVRPEFHDLRLAQKNDRWYLGSGAIHSNIADDYAARSGGGASDLGRLADVGVSWAVNKDATLYVYYGHFFGGDVVRNFYSKRQAADLGYAELTVNF